MTLLRGTGPAAAGSRGMRSDAQQDPAREETEERWTTLAALEDWLEVPMLVLSFVWLLLVVLELAWGTSSLMVSFGTAIWIVFVAEFTLRLALAPDKRSFIARNWLTLAALVAPAFRLLRGLRLLRAAQAARGLRLVKIIGTANRSIGALRASLGRRGVGYVLALTALVVTLGAAGMLAFEPAPEVPGGFRSYWDALWWTSMLVTTMGSQFWPQTAEGRVLCFLLALYGLAVFGYITASLASFFVGKDAAGEDGSSPAAAEVAELRDEIRRLRLEIGRPDARE